MKKVLLATSALTMLAGAAAAQMTVGGSARMGVYNDSAGTVTERRMRINVSGSGESDSGISFGAWARFQSGNAKDGFLGATGVMSGSNVWISNGTMTLTVGNSGGAVNQVGGLYAVGGCGFSASPSYQQYCANVLNQGNGSFAQTSSGGAGPNIVRLDFALGSANVSISGGNTNDAEIAVGFALGSVNLAVGFDNGAAATGGTYVSVSGDAGSAQWGVTYYRTTAGATQYIAKAATAVGAGSVGAFLANDGAGNRWGLNYSQSLGGGAAATVAITNQAAAGAGGQLAGTTVTAGVTMGF